MVSLTKGEWSHYRDGQFNGRRKFMLGGQFNGVRMDHRYTGGQFKGGRMVIIEVVSLIGGRKVMLQRWSV